MRPDVDWHTLVWAFVAFVCVIALLAMIVPDDAGVQRDKNDDDPPPPIFPPF